MKLKLKTQIQITFITFITLLLASCSKDSAAEGSKITSFSLTQSNDKIILNYATNSSDINHFEFAYSAVAASNTPGDGNLFVTTDLNTTTKNIDDLSIAPGTSYNFSIRVYENNGYVSPWFGVKLLNTTAYCSQPYNLSLTAGCTWDYNTAITPTNFQVQYGSQGFTLGNGISGTTTSNYYDYSSAILHSGSSYDFYVRSFCSTSLGYSDWVGPASLTATSDQNVLMPPTNIGWSVIRNFFGDATGASFTWLDQGGNHSYDTVIVGHGNPPTSVAYNNTMYNTTVSYLMQQSTNFDFYIRTVCVDGTKSNWVGPLTINIGT